ncbi:MAG: hypothetical protein ACE5FA_06155 [Dehalococcoidia bacterium]
MAQAVPFMMLALTAASTAAQVGGGIASARAAKQQAKVQRRLGQIEAEDVRRESRRLLARQRVAFAKAGVSTTAGTPLDVFADAAAEAELTALRRIFERESGAVATRSAGKQAGVQGGLGGLSTVLGSIGPITKAFGRT